MTVNIALSASCDYTGGGTLIEANARRLGVQPAAVIEADALTALGQMPRPDRVFLGGGGRQRAQLLQAVIDCMNPGGVVVIAMANVEALAELRPLLTNAGWSIQISQQQACRGQPLADGTRLAPMNPVMILSGSKAKG